MAHFSICLNLLTGISYDPYAVLTPDQLCENFFMADHAEILSQIHDVGMNAITIESLVNLHCSDTASIAYHEMVKTWQLYHNLSNALGKLHWLSL